MYRTSQVDWDAAMAILEPVAFRPPGLWAWRGIWLCVRRLLYAIERETRMADRGMKLCSLQAMRLKVTGGIFGGTFLSP